MAKTKSTNTRKTSRKKNDNIAARTGRTIKQQPYVSAAIATGAVTAVAAAVAGAFFFRRNQEAIGDFAEDVSDKIKGGLSDARDQAVKGARKVKEKAAFLLNEASDEANQSEILEEALSLKQTGKKTSRPIDDTIDNEIKAGSASY